MAYRIVVTSLVVCLLLVVGLLMLERTGFIEMDEKTIQPEVVSCQIGHKDMEVRVLGARAAYRGEVVPRYEFWLPPFGGCAVYYWDRPNLDQEGLSHGGDYADYWIRRTEERTSNRFPAHYGCAVQSPKMQGASPFYPLYSLDNSVL